MFVYAAIPGSTHAHGIPDPEQKPSPKKKKGVGYQAGILDMLQQTPLYVHLIQPYNMIGFLKVHTTTSRITFTRRC